MGYTQDIRSGYPKIPELQMAAPSLPEQFSLLPALLHLLDIAQGQGQDQANILQSVRGAFYFLLSMRLIAAVRRVEGEGGTGPPCLQAAPSDHEEH